MYGMGAGPTGGRSVVFLDGSYDLNGRAIADPPLRDGGIPERRVSVFDYAAVGPVVETVNTAAVVPVPAVVINSSGPAPTVQGDVVDTSLPDWPWYVWAGGIAGVWYLFKGGRR